MITKGVKKLARKSWWLLSQVVHSKPPEEKRSKQFESLFSLNQLKRRGREREKEIGHPEWIITQIEQDRWWFKCSWSLVSIKPRRNGNECSTFISKYYSTKPNDAFHDNSIQLIDHLTTYMDLEVKNVWRMRVREK